MSNTNYLKIPEPRELGVHCARCGDDAWYLEEDDHAPPSQRYTVCCDCTYPSSPNAGVDYAEALHDWQDWYTSDAAQKIKNL